MRQFPHLPPGGAVDEWVGFGAAFDGARFPSAGTCGHLVLGNDFQQADEELFLLFARAGLRDGHAELARYRRFRYGRSPMACLQRALSIRMRRIG